MSAFLFVWSGLQSLAMVQVWGDGAKFMETFDLSASCRTGNGEN